MLAKPGDTYVFSGVVTNIDLRSSTLALENRSDDETYELHFDQSAVDDKSKLKVGSEVTAHVVFNGKQYNANDLQLQAANATSRKQNKDRKSSSSERIRLGGMSAQQREASSSKIRVRARPRSCRIRCLELRASAPA